ncbi:MAG: YlxM family DNA-binding protein [Limnochordia bacterium]
MEKTLRMALLFDAYSDLLTEKQRLVFALYHHEDLSLGEIAETYGISRQGVYDILKRSEKSLLQFEERLQLVMRYERTRQIIEHMDTAVDQLRALIGELDSTVCEKASAALDTLSEGLTEIGRLST